MHVWWLGNVHAWHEWLLGIRISHGMRDASGVHGERRIRNVHMQYRCGMWQHGWGQVRRLYARDDVQFRWPVVHLPVLIGHMHERRLQRRYVLHQYVHQRKQTVPDDDSLPDTDV